MADAQKVSSGRFPLAKVTALGRLKSFTDTFAPRRDKSGFIFPPPSWEIEKLNIDSSDGGGQENLQSASETSSTGTETVAGLAETAGSTEIPTFEPEESEPQTFAQRIRELVYSLPFPGASTLSRPTTVDAMTETQVLKAEDGSTGPPIPPGVDRDLVRMLSSEDVMNGDEELNGKSRATRQSVWSALSGMQQREKNKATGDQQEPVSEAQGGLMMYAPLEPMNDSQVELAEVRSTIDAPTAADSQPEEQPNEHVEWVPSTTQMSVYTTWWGYRLYLPPPVMITLDSTSLKATAQAAMVTSALKWLLNKVPDMLVPPQFKAPLQLLKRLGPVVGYIGVFIAWSWGRIKTHDKGNGVVLTATWLLPVALIPMAWDAGDIFRPVLLPKPGDRKPALSQEEEQERISGNKGSELEDGKGKKKGFWHFK